MSTPWNPKTEARAVHVYCAADKEDKINKVLCSTYNKKRKWNYVTSKLPEGNFFQYAPFRMKNKIALTDRQSAQLNKSKIV